MEMDSQRCDQCGSTVAADEQFCPQCGTFLDPLAPPNPPPQRRRPASGNVISVGSDGPYEEFSLGSIPPPEAESMHGSDQDGRSVTCPSCGAPNPTSNRHCQECGARLQQGPLPTAPRPAVPATAGVRAAFAISGLLFLVIVVAVLFNIFGDGEGVAAPETTTTTTTPLEVQEPDVIDILDQTCEPQGLGGFACANLTSGTTDEYQVNWEDLLQDEGTITIRLTFREPMFVSRIEWTNISTDETRFRQNYRARGLVLRAQGSVTDVLWELEDRSGPQTIDFAAVNATWIEIRIESAWNAQVVDGNVWPDLAIEEITVIGRPAATPTDATAPDGTTTTTEG